MRDEIILKLYANEQYLDYLRRHPKWYYFLDLDPQYFSEFERVVKKALKLTTSDRLETLKNQVNFAGSLIKYLASQ
ncbi:MAG TPA: hypothetical protein GX692_00780 [Acholeplasmataceae bacterium]|jgi:hypothetical protein|nr:hypothetical protein [Acholeplasmataceae bacterium]